MRAIKKIGFFCAFIIPAMVVAGFYAGGYWNFLSLGFVFVVIPVLDQLVGNDPENVAPSAEAAIAEELYYRLITYCWVYAQVVFLCWALWVFATYVLSTAEAIGLLVGTALVTGGIGITVAHELGHKKSELERFYAQVLLATVCYMHFYIEHNLGHHVHVATPHDPATSRKNENFYAFWLRTVSGGWLSAWRIEQQLLSRKGKTVWSIHNRMLRYIAIPLLLVSIATLLIGLLSGQMDLVWWKVPLFFFAQSLLGFSLLEAVNYIEHYGILRRETSPGRYERVNPLHSWNANQLISNFFLFQLQRHSDHHAYAHRRYQVLRHIEESPQLPSGYPAMILLALVPPLWFKLMNPRLEAWQRLRNYP